MKEEMNEREKKSKMTPMSYAFVFLIAAAVLFLIIWLSSNKETNTEPEIVIPEEPNNENTAAPIPRVLNDCGDGVCGANEVYATCQEDCVETCGDGAVQSDENWKNCRYDLLYQCGDGVCQSWEHYRYCPSDCSECIVDDRGTYQPGELINGVPVCEESPRWVI